MATVAIAAVLILIALGAALFLTQRAEKARASAPSKATAAARSPAPGKAADSRADSGAPPSRKAPSPASKAAPAPAAGRAAGKAPRKPAKLPTRTNGKSPNIRPGAAGDSSPPKPRPRPASEEDDEPEMTLVATRPALGDLPALATSLVDDDETPVPRPATAVPIVFDADAALDEPTRVEKLILVSAVGQTDRGQRRKKNEDSYAMVEEHDLFVVADGMGGHAGGEIASRIAVDVMAGAFRDETFPGEAYPDVPRRGGDLARAIQMGNAAIFARARAELELTGMGTTVVSAAFSPKKQRVYIGHVGDSRCYRLRQGELVQLTTDHTMGNAGITGPMAEHLERAVGIAPTVKVDIIIGRPQPGDLYLLCSDGLTKMVKPDAIRDILLAQRAEADGSSTAMLEPTVDAEAAELTVDAEPDDASVDAASPVRRPLQRAVAALIDRANASGGRDNITVILVEVTTPQKPA